MYMLAREYQRKYSMCRAEIKLVISRWWEKNISRSKHVIIFFYYFTNMNTYYYMYSARYVTIDIQNVRIYFIRSFMVNVCLIYTHKCDAYYICQYNLECYEKKFFFFHFHTHIIFRISMEIKTSQPLKICKCLE